MFKCEIRSGCGLTVLRLLRQVYMKMSVNQTGGKLYDVDGNEVGEWSYEEKD